MLFSFSKFFSVLAIFQVLDCAFLMFHVRQCFLSYSNFYSVCVTFLTFFRFLAIFQILQCAHLIFHFFSVSHNIRGPTVCVSLFPNLPVFLPILHVLQIVFPPTVFSVSCHIPCPIVCISHFPCFSEFLAIVYVLQFVFLIFHIVQCF